MTVELHASFTGHELSRALAEEPEEFGYLLDDLCTRANNDFIAEVVEHSDGRDDLIRWLRALADEIEGAA